MRQARLKAFTEQSVAYYHCISRVVERRFLLADQDREQFVAFLRLCEQFCGLRVITYCVLSNHFHILVEVPRRPAVLLSDEELLAKLGKLYSRGHVKEVRVCRGGGWETREPIGVSGGDCGGGRAGSGSQGGAGNVSGVVVWAGGGGRGERAWGANGAMRAGSGAGEGDSGAKGETADGGICAVSGAVFCGRGGVGIEGVCGRGVCDEPGTVWGQAEGRGAAVAVFGGRIVVCPSGFTNQSSGLKNGGVIFGHKIRVKTPVAATR